MAWAPAGGRKSRRSPPPPLEISFFLCYKGDLLATFFSVEGLFATILSLWGRPFSPCGDLFGLAPPPPLRKFLRVPMRTRTYKCSIIMTAYMAALFFFNLRLYGHSHGHGHGHSDSHSHSHTEPNMAAMVRNGNNS